MVHGPTCSHRVHVQALLQEAAQPSSSSKAESSTSAAASTNSANSPMSSSIDDASSTAGGSGGTSSRLGGSISGSNGSPEKAKRSERTLPAGTISAVRGRGNAVGVAATAGPSPNKPRIRVPGQHIRWEAAAAAANAIAQGIPQSDSASDEPDAPYGNLYAALQREQQMRQVRHPPARRS